MKLYKVQNVTNVPCDVKNLDLVRKGHNGSKSFNPCAKQNRVEMVRYMFVFSIALKIAFCCKLMLQ